MLFISDSTMTMDVHTDNAIINNSISEKICREVEFYFSDENLMKDMFLLRHIQKNNEGFVSLKLIASFKKVKQICNDRKIIASALLKSEKIEINPSQTKIRRLKSYSLEVDQLPHRLLFTDPVKKISMEYIFEIFNAYGELMMIEIFPSGLYLPYEVIEPEIYYMYTND